MSDISWHDNPLHKSNPLSGEMPSFSGLEPNIGQRLRRRAPPPRSGGQSAIRSPVPAGVVFSDPTFVDQWCSSFFAGKRFAFGSNLKVDFREFNLSQLNRSRPAGSGTATAAYTVQSSGAGVISGIVGSAIAATGIEEEIMDVLVEILGDWYQTLCADIVPYLGIATSAATTSLYGAKICSLVIQRYKLRAPSALTEADLRTLNTFLPAMRQLLRNEGCYAGSRFAISGAGLALKTTDHVFDWAGAGSAAVGAAEALAKLCSVAVYIGVAYKQMKAANALLAAPPSNFTVALFDACPLAACYLLQHARSEQTTSALLDVATKTVADGMLDMDLIEDLVKNHVGPCADVARKHIGSSMLALVDDQQENDA